MHPAVVHVDAKIDRAKEHICQLEIEIGRFKESNPYEIITEDAPHAGRRFRLRVVNGIPVRLGAIVGDVLHNLRSSLDVLVWQLVFSLTGTRPGRWATFPFAETIQKFEAIDMGKIEAASKDAVRLLKATKPYQGGNDALWALHRLDIADKHHLLLPVATVAERTSINMGDQLIDLSFLTGNRSTTPLEDGAILIGFFGDQSLYTEAALQLDIRITFGRDQIFEGKPLLSTLLELTQVVEGTIKPFRSLFPEA